MVALMTWAGCGGEGEKETQGPAAETQAVSTQAASSQPQRPSIVGDWERTTTCDELVQALRDAGMDELVDEFVAGNGFIRGVDDNNPEQIDLAQPCRGAVPRIHIHTFGPDGKFFSYDWKGQLVDEGRYRVTGDKLVISKEFPAVTFRIRLKAGTLMLNPLNIPHGCTTFRCGWSIAMAYPGKTWMSVS
jgi:hypothetical protein